MSEAHWSRDVLPGFIVIEGLDGAGTTTQARQLAAHYGEHGVFTWEPTDFVTGRTIRSLLSGPERGQPETLALLFAADRNEHLYRPESGICAHIADGRIVVCDRYLFSSLAYQGAFADPAFVARLNAPFPLPEHLIFIDTPLDEAYRRIEQRGGSDPGSRDSLEERSVQERVAPRYYAVLEEFSHCEAVSSGGMRIHRIDGRGTAEDVFTAILRALD